MARLTQSYAHGVSNTPLIGDTIGVHFDKSAERWPDRPALIVRQQNVRWTYRELKEQVDAFAAGLLALGLAPGDRIGIWSPNNAEWVITQFATAKAGLILVNINPAYRTYELEYALNKVGCKALITAERFKTSDYLGMLRELMPEIEGAAPGEVRAKRVPTLTTLIRIDGGETPGYVRFDDVLGMGGERHRRMLAELQPKLQFDDAINIQFTSGTTGAPKGATLTHHNLLNNGYFIGEAQRLTDRDKVCIPVPLYHCFGMVLGNLACVTHGSAMVYPGEGFDPLATLETVESERCTALYGVPTMFIAELGHPEFKRFDLTSLRTGIMAGSPCPIEVMRRCVAEMNMREVTIAYGMTETSPVSTQTSCDPRRRERLSARDRRIPVPPSQGRGGAGRGRARPEIRRGAVRVDQAEIGRCRDAGGDPGVLQGTDRPLQDPALHQVRRRLSDDRHRQGAEVHHARTDDRGARCLYQKSDSAIMVMKPAENRHRYDAARVLDGAMDRSVFVERPMSPQLVVVGGIPRQNPAEVRFAQDNHVVDALASDRSDQPFCEAVLPGRARGDGPVADAHGWQSVHDGRAVDPIPDGFVWPEASLPLWPS
jgi:acyl-CoA synthetase (AMP-forming)/AMP-acid ligase II